MNSEQVIAGVEDSVLHTYNRSPIVFDRGEGVYLTDTEGRSYLDFGAGIAVCALGYGNQEYADALTKQAGQLMHTSNLFYHAPLAQAASKLTKASGMDKVFFTNSGTEAVEGALKAAREYAYKKDGRTDHEIIAVSHSFHGRSIGALSVTGNPAYREPFRPLMGGVKFAEFNNLESVRSQVTEQTCAVILETVQGEGGVYPAQKEFLQGVCALCDERDILLILDEIQCGMGRTGSWFAYQQYGVSPDIMTAAKALGCGFPVGAFALNKKTAQSSLAAGDHGSTYGGSPLACAVVSEVFDLFEELNLVEHVRELTPYLEEQLDQLVDRYAFLSCRHGMGFMQGITVTGRQSQELISSALDHGLIVLGAEGNVIRFVPPLIIGKDDIDEMIRRLESSF